MRINRTNRKVSKYESIARQKQVMEYRLKGEGVYIFRNKNKAATLDLPKPANDGRVTIAPNGEWEGDNYFMHLVPKEALLVRQIKAPEPKTPEVVTKLEEATLTTEGNKMEEKLILDQPDTVTHKGIIEHVVVDPKNKPINEIAPDMEKGPKNILLTEDPLAGVQILMSE